MVCGEDVYPGDRVYEYYGNMLHEDCATYCTLDVLLAAMDAKPSDPLKYFDESESILSAFGFILRRAACGD